MEKEIGKKLEPRTENIEQQNGLSDYIFSWIKNISMPDNYTILIQLYKKGKKAFLLSSVKKSDKRFHLLLADKLDKRFFIANPLTTVLNRYLKGGQIIKISCGDTESYITIKTNTEKEQNLLLKTDFANLNFVLSTEDGKTIAALHNRTQQNEEPIYRTDEDLISGKPIYKTGRDTDELSEEYIRFKSLEIKNRILKQLKKLYKKTEILKGKLENEMKEVIQKEKYKKAGELIKYNLRIIKRGMKRIKIKDFTGEEVEIALNPSLSPLENMEFYFKKYKKLSSKEPKLEQRIKKIKEELDTIKDIIELTSSSEKPFFLMTIENIVESIARNREENSPGDAKDSAKTGAGKNKNLPDEKIKRLILESLISIGNEKKSGLKASEKKEPFLKLLTGSGKTMLVGKSAGENELLIKRYARGNDLWFHAEEVGGSHVVLRHEKKESFKQRDIEDAAMIAAYYSKLRKSGGGNIVYTHCKYLNKPKDSKPGLFIYYNNKTIYVKIDENKVKDILERSFINNKP